MKFLKSISLFCLILVLILAGAYFFFFRQAEGSILKAAPETASEETDTAVDDLTVSTKQNVTT